MNLNSVLIGALLCASLTACQVGSGMPSPLGNPAPQPTVAPTADPSASPSEAPSADPSASPSEAPSADPSASPSAAA